MVCPFCCFCTEREELTLDAGVKDEIQQFLLNQNIDLVGFADISDLHKGLRQQCLVTLHSTTLVSLHVNSRLR
jgi:hypothetical protein